MNHPRSELLANDVRLRKNRSLLLLMLVGLVLCFLGGWLMLTADVSGPEQVSEAFNEEI